MRKTQGSIQLPAFIIIGQVAARHRQSTMKPSLIY